MPFLIIGIIIWIVFIAGGLVFSFLAIIAGFVIGLAERIIIEYKAYKRNKGQK